MPPRASIPLILVALSACLCCTTPNELYCEKAADCSEGAKGYCDINGTQPGNSLTNTCVAKPAAGTCNRVETCPGGACKGDSESADGTCVECTGNEHCEGTLPMCDTETNLCVAAGCEPGVEGDALCLAQSSATPYCQAPNLCTACIENAHCLAATAAICDGDNFECRGCEDGADCESTLCTTETGVCVAQSDIVYVDTGGIDDAGCGDFGDACLTISEGLNQIGGNRTIVLVGAGTYSEQLSISSGTASLIANGVVILNPPLNSGGDAVLTVSNTASLTVEGLRFAPVSGVSGTDAVRCSGSSASLVLRKVEVTNAEDAGIQTNDCTLSLFDSTISNNDGGGLDIDNSGFTIVNNLIVNNGRDGDSGSDVGGVFFNSTSGETEIFEFNTLSGNGIDNGAIGGSAVTCSSTNLSASSNILVEAGQGGGMGIVAGACSFDYSLIEGVSPFPGTENIIGDPLFEEANTGNYHLMSGSPCIDKATPSTAITTDIDGEIRPQGGRADIGADEAE